MPRSMAFQIPIVKTRLYDCNVTEYSPIVAMHVTHNPTFRKNITIKKLRVLGLSRMFRDGYDKDWNGKFSLEEFISWYAPQ